MQSAPNAWKENIKAKLEKLRQSLLLYLSTHEDTAADEVATRLTTLKMMFADNQIPGPLRQLEGAFAQVRGHKSQPAFLPGLINAYNALPSIADFSEAEPPSFDTIFESYKNDEQLTKLVNELVALLERILSEADDILTAHIARELEVILQQLKKRDRKSLYELQSWIDLTARTLTMVVETHTGTHGLNLVYEAGRLAWRIQNRLIGGIRQSSEAPGRGTPAYVRRESNKGHSTHPYG